VGELPEAEPGQPYSLTVIAIDAEGVAPVVTAETLPLGIQFAQITDGVANIEWQVPEDVNGDVTFELIAIDVQDRSLITTLSITIPVSSETESQGPSAPDSPAPDSPEPDASTPDSPAPDVPEAPAEPPAQETPDTPADVATPVEPEDAPDATTPDTPDASIIADDDPSADATVVTSLATDGDLPPIIVGLEDIQIAVGQSIRRTVVPVDPEGIVAALRLESTLEDIQFIDNGNGSRDLIWTPTENDIGSQELRFVATDSGQTPHVIQQLMNIEVIAAQDSAEDTLNVEPDSPVNFSPVFVPVAISEVSAGETLSFTVHPIDPNGSVPILHVAAPPEGSSFTDNGDGSRTFSWTVPEDFADELQLMFAATDTDDLGVTVEQSVTIRVLP